MNDFLIYLRQWIRRWVDLAVAGGAARFAAGVGRAESGAIGELAAECIVAADRLPSARAKRRRSIWPMCGPC